MKDLRLDDPKDDGVMYVVRLDPELAMKIDNIAASMEYPPQEVIRDAVKIICSLSIFKELDDGHKN